MPLPFFDFDLETPTQGLTTTAQRGLVGLNFDPTGELPVDGLLQLPGWLGIQCATAGRTSQQSANTVHENYPVNAARAYSQDGVTFGLLIEPASTNLITTQDLTAWTDNGTPTFATAVTPTGSSESCEMIDNDAGASEYKSRSVGTLTSGNFYTMSCWRFNLEAEDSTVQLSRGAQVLLDSTVGLQTAWTYTSGGGTVSATGSGTAALVPRAVTADQGNCRFWGPQVEQREYPTSVRPTVRAADILRAWTDAITFEGRLSWTIKYRPHYAHTETAGFDHNLVWFNASNRLYFFETGGIASIRLMVDGADVVSRNLTFTRHTQLTIMVESSDMRLALTITGAATGDGTTVAVAIPAFETLPSVTYILGSDAGAEEGSDLLFFAGGRETFCELTDERALQQMSEDPRNFRDLLCALAEQPARYFDVALGIRAALELETALGAQLDLIGSVVGLAREGFTDDRYRVFLTIQTQLLLAATRDDAAWTGTGENILAIARLFVGDAIVDPITLTNYPPYSYELDVPGLVLSEAELLARFLTTANYAAVLGLMIIILAGDSLWGTNTGSITDDAIWCSASVVVGGCGTWNTVVVT